MMDQIRNNMSSLGGICEGVQVPARSTSSVLTPSNGQGPQKRAKPQLQRNPRYLKSPNVSIAPPPPTHTSWLVNLVVSGAR